MVSLFQVGPPGPVRSHRIDVECQLQEGRRMVSLRNQALCLLCPQPNLVAPVSVLGGEIPREHQTPPEG